MRKIGLCGAQHWVQVRRIRYKASSLRLQYGVFLHECRIGSLYGSHHSAAVQMSKDGRFWSEITVIGDSYLAFLAFR